MNARIETKLQNKKNALARAKDRLVAVEAATRVYQRQQLEGSLALKSLFSIVDRERTLIARLSNQIADLEVEALKEIEIEPPSPRIHGQEDYRCRYGFYPCGFGKWTFKVGDDTIEHIGRFEVACEIALGQARRDGVDIAYLQP